VSVKFSCRVKIVSFVACLLLLFCSCKLCSLTVVGPYTYEQDCRLLRRIGKALDDNLQIIDDKVDTIDSKVVIVDQKFDTVDSKVDVIDDKVDLANTELGSIESKLDDWIGPLSETIDSKVDVLVQKSDTIDSKVDVIDEKTDTIDSKVDVLDDKVDLANTELGSIESKLDDWIGPLSETIDSKVDVLDDKSDTIDSKVDVLDEKSDTVDSKVDVLDDKSDTIDSKVDVIDDKVDLANTELGSIESKLDDWIGPLNETIDSKVDTLLSFKGDVIPPCPSGNITTSGMYSLAGNQTCCITIDADDVTLDLSGFTLYCDSGNAVIEILSGHKNIEIINGKIKSDGSIDGILAGSNSELVSIENIKIFSCDTGINFNGTSGDNIKSCKVTNCEIQDCNKGVYGEYLIKSVFKECEAYNCVEAGFELQYSDFNVFEKCKALETQNDDLGEDAIGFKSFAGRANLFTECLSEGTVKTDSNFCTEATGFLLTGNNLSMEEETKIINCIANSSSILMGTGLAYGIHLEPSLLPRASEFIFSAYAIAGGVGINASIDWSPDDQYIAIPDGFVAGDGIRVLSFDGMALSEISTATYVFGGLVNGISWHPIQNVIAIGGLEVAGLPEVRVLSFDGTYLSEIPTATYEYEENILDVDWDPTGSYLAIGGDNGPDGEQVRVLGFDGTYLSEIPTATYNHGYLIVSVQWSKDGFLAIGGVGPGASDSVRVFSFDGSLLSLKDSVAPGLLLVYSVAWSADGQYLAVGAYQGVSEQELYIYSFDGNSLSLVKSVDFSPESIVSVGWSPVANYLAAGTDAEQIFVYDFDGSSLDQLAVYENATFLNNDPTHIAWTSGGNFFGTITSSYASVTSFDAFSNALYEHGATVNSVAWSPSSLYLAVGGESAADGTAIRALRYDGFPLSTLASYDHGATVNSVAWSSNCDYMVAGGASGAGGAQVRVLGFDGYSLSRIISGTYDHGAEINSVSWSPINRYIAAGGVSGAGGHEVRAFGFDGSLLKLLHSYGHGGTVNSVDWAPSADYLAVGGANGTGNYDVRVLKFNGAVLSEIGASNFAFYNHGGTINSVVWSPGGNNLAIGGAGGFGGYEVRVLNFDGASLSGIANYEHGNTVNSVSWSSDGKYLAVWGDSANGAVLSFDGSSLLLQYDYQALDNNEINSVDWSSNGNFIATGGGQDSYGAEVRSFSAMISPARCLLDGNRTCNTRATNVGIRGIGIAGGENNTFIRNIGAENNINFTYGLHRAVGLNSLANVFDNLWTPPYGS